jgi:ankyrin repeat protein
MVRLLIDNGASPTAKLGNFPPAELARRYDQSAVYEYLISRGGIPVDRRRAAQLLLIEATRRGDVAAVERAMKEGAFINGTDSENTTALKEAVGSPIYVPSQAATMSRAATIWWLLDHGADPNQGDRRPPLHTFVTMNTHTPIHKSGGSDATPMVEETLARLLKAGAKVSGRDWQDRTPLHEAAASDNVRAAEILIAEGAKIMARDKAGKTPLDYAESAAMIKLLKANGAIER